MSDRDSGRGRDRERAGDSRHHIDRHTCRTAHGDLLAAPAKDERVATLEAHHPATGLRVLDEQSIDLVLRHRMSARCLADVQDQHAGREFVQDRPRREPVADHHIGRRQFPASTQRQQIGITRPAADQYHPPGSRPVSAQRQRPGVEPHRDGIADRDRTSRIRRNAGCGNRTHADHQTIPAHHSRSSRRSRRGVIGPHAEDPQRRGVPFHRPVGGQVPGRREGEPGTVEIIGAKVAVLPAQQPRCGVAEDLLAGVGRHHQDVRAGRQAGRDLARRHRSPADHQHAAAGQRQVQRQHLVRAAYGRALGDHREVRHLRACGGIRGCRRTR